MPLPYKTSAKSKDTKKPTVIIRKVRRTVNTPPHGSAWKVAYADFVTAMMAFFLLLWLISTSSKDTLQGLAEYFTPTAGVAEMRPIGLNNAAPTSLNQTDPGINLSAPGVMQRQAGSAASNPQTQAPDQGDQDDNLFEDGATAINQALKNDPVLQEYRENVQVGQTPEGLRIDLRDSNQHPMFEAGTATLTEHGQRVLSRLVPLIRRMPNYLAITGYTDATTQDAPNAIMRWQVSTARAEGTLRFMLQIGMEPERTQKIIGMADKEFVGDDPRHARNRRISLLMLRGSHILIPASAVPGGGD